MKEKFYRQLSLCSLQLIQNLFLTLLSTLQNHFSFSHPEIHFWNPSIASEFVFLKVNESF